MRQAPRGAAVPGHTSFQSEGVVYNGKFIPAYKFIRLLECPNLPALKQMLWRKEALWQSKWSDHAGAVRYPKSILFRSNDPQWSTREIYGYAQNNTDFGRYTSPGKKDDDWHPVLLTEFVNPVRELVSAMDMEANPETAAQRDVLIPFSIQLLKYKKGEGGFEKTAHQDPKAYEYIATCNIEGNATIHLWSSSHVICWSQPVGGGEIYILGGPSVREWKHSVRCHTSSEQRIVAVLRFVRKSKLKELI